MVVVTFQFTASAVNWRGRLNEYQTHAVGQRSELILLLSKADTEKCLSSFLLRPGTDIYSIAQFPGQDLTLQSKYCEGMISAFIKKVHTGVFNA